MVCSHVLREFSIALTRGIGFTLHASIRRPGGPEAAQRAGLRAGRDLSEGTGRDRSEREITDWILRHGVADEGTGNLPSMSTRPDEGKALRETNVPHVDHSPQAMRGSQVRIPFWNR